jgi:hypothetical protein
MDAVVKGLIGGAAISLILFFGGLITLNSWFAEIMKNPQTVGIWLVVLTALTAGQLFLTYSITAALMVAPAQTKTTNAQ